MQPETKKAFLWAGLALLIILSIIFSAKLIHIYNNQLPSLEQLHNIEPSLTTTIYSADGEVLQEYYLQRRILVPLKKMPSVLLEALLATEDQRFYQHWGVDLPGVIRAFFSNIRKGDLTAQGGSTITQQLARTLFLTPEKVVSRKIKEILTALKIERTYSKDEILEMYLNQCYFGKGAYGIQAAAQVFFSKDARELTLPECALLVGVLKSPNRYSPLDYPDLALNRRNLVLRAMEDNGKLTEEECDSLKALPLLLKTSSSKTGLGPYFSEMVRQYLIEEYGEKSLYNGGLSGSTTLYPEMQKTAAE